MAYLLAPPDNEIHPQPEIGGKGTDLLDKSGYRDRKEEVSRGEGKRGGGLVEKIYPEEGFLTSDTSRMGDTYTNFPHLPTGYPDDRYSHRITP